MLVLVSFVPMTSSTNQSRAFGQILFSLLTPTSFGLKIYCPVKFVEHKRDQKINSIPAKARNAVVSSISAVRRRSLTADAGPTMERALIGRLLRPSVGRLNFENIRSFSGLAHGASRPIAT
jgi:hypothetical protein